MSTLKYFFPKKSNFLKAIYNVNHHILYSTIILLLIDTLEKRPVNIFCKGYNSKYFRFLDYMTSVTIIQHCHYGVKVALNKWAWLCFNRTLFNWAACYSGSNPCCREALGHVHQEPHTRMFKAALFIIRTLKTNRKSIKKRMDINKTWYSPPAEYHTAMTMMKWSNLPIHQ